MAGFLCACCLTCPCCPGCKCCSFCKRCQKIVQNLISGKCCSCWRFLFSDERNCDCCYCAHTEDSRCQCCHCSCSEYPNCRCCCCSCATNRNCKCLCCTNENTECHCYDSRCCSNLSDVPHRGGYKLKRRRIGSGTSIISLEKDASAHGYFDQLVCPVCGKLFLRPMMLPCNHCICDKCMVKSQTHAEITENYFILTCPTCNKAHCLPFSRKLHLRVNYLRAKLARKYMRRHGFLRWRFDKSHFPIYCQVCDEQRKATKRCVTCQLYYCNTCLKKLHQDVTYQNHVYAKIDDTIWEETSCMVHGDSLLSKYCLDDNELICDHCCESHHSDHNTVSLAVATSKMAAALFAAIAKFKKVRFVIDNDLMEILVMKNNFKSYKETKRKEIRNGFIKLRLILQQREKELMEAVENIELQKQQALCEYAAYTTKRINQMDSLMQYSKEALKEGSQLSFLQSANCLVNEIEDAIANVYQPSPHLKEDPIKYLKVDFEELAESLQSIFPSLKNKLHYDRLARCPYPCSSDIMIPKNISSVHIPNPLGLSRSQSLASLSSLDGSYMMNNELSIRPKSSPPPKMKNNGIYAVWHASSNTSGNESHSVYHNPEVFGESSLSVPGVVVVYQTLVYPTVAKIYWTCPTEEVESFEVAYYEVFEEDAIENIIQPQLIGVLTGIVQQNLEIHNLTPNTEYLFKVRAVNENGPGEWSEICKVVTPDVRAKAKGRWGLLRNIQAAIQRPTTA